MNNVTYKLLKQKFYSIPITLCLIIMTLNLIKHPFVFYIPFNIPGEQMACTIPPFGIFIESGIKKSNFNDPCLHPLKHEMIHWEQYEKMGLISFYYNYLKCYLKSGRINNWMEEEAREPCKLKNNM